MTDSRRRTWLFRTTAILVGLLPLLLFELVLRLTGLPAPDELYDPWIAFEDVRPLFELGNEQDRYQVAESRQAFFGESGFTANKDSSGFRIFCLGGSTVQGRPYQPATAFGKWLELSLQAADSSRQWEVVNCGGVSYASYRLVPILEEVLGHQPDLVIIYTGHNEFLEDRTYRDIREPSSLARLSHQAVSHVRTVSLARRGWLALVGHSQAVARQQLPVEVEARLDPRGKGLASYQRDDNWHHEVTNHFGFNLRRMIQLTRQAGVPLLLVNPVEDLRDSPPFKSTFADTLNPGQLQHCEQLLKSAASGSSLLVRERIELLDELLNIDPRRADALYLQGRFMELQGDVEEAKRLYLRAKDEDLCPLRMTEAMHRLTVTLARQQDVPLVDVRADFSARMFPVVVGRPAMIDHVHPSIEGHQWIAAALLEQVVEMGMITLPKGWEQRRVTLVRDHLATLDEVYYAEGRRRLEGLRMWTRGLAGRIDLMINKDFQSENLQPAVEETP